MENLFNNHDFGRFQMSNGVSSVFDALMNMAVAILCVTLITPIASGKGTPICTPLAMITVYGMLIAIFVKL